MSYGGEYDIKVNGFGVFEIHWHEGGHSRRKSLKTKDQQEAFTRASRFLEQGRLEQQNWKDPDFVSLVSFYMSNHIDEVIDAVRIDVCNRHLLEHFGGHKLNDFTPELVRAYRKKREGGSIGKPSGNGTIRRELGHLIAVMNFAAKRGMIKREKVPFIDLPQSPPPKQRWLTVEEINHISKLAKGRGRVELFFHIAVRTASRPTAICELTWDKIDFQRNLIEFGKGDVRVRRSKRRATVPISDKLLPILREAYNKELVRVDGDIERVKGMFVLGGVDSVRTTFTNLMTDAKMTDVTPHTLRHTWATHASMSGVSMIEIARVLGDTLATVERVYAKFAPGYLKSAVNAVNF